MTRSSNSDMQIIKRLRSTLSMVLQTSKREKKKWDNPGSSRVLGAGSVVRLLTLLNSCTAFCRTGGQEWLLSSLTTRTMHMTIDGSKSGKNSRERKKRKRRTGQMEFSQRFSSLNMASISFHWLVVSASSCTSWWLIARILITSNFLSSRNGNLRLSKRSKKRKRSQRKRPCVTFIGGKVSIRKPKKITWVQIKSKKRQQKNKEWNNKIQNFIMKWKRGNSLNCEGKGWYSTRKMSQDKMRSKERQVETHHWRIA